MHDLKPSPCLIRSTSLGQLPDEAPEGDDEPPLDGLGEEPPPEGLPPPPEGLGEGAPGDGVWNS